MEETVTDLLIEKLEYQARFMTVPGQQAIACAIRVIKQHQAEQACHVLIPMRYPDGSLLPTIDIEEDLPTSNSKPIEFEGFGNVKQCEIPDNGKFDRYEEAWKLSKKIADLQGHYSHGERDWTIDAQLIYNAICDWAREIKPPTEPVSVDLKKCEIAHAKASEDCAMGLLNRGQDETKYIVKSVLDAARVKYVD